MKDGSMHHEFVSTHHPYSVFISSFFSSVLMAKSHFCSFLNIQCQVHLVLKSVLKWTITIFTHNIKTLILLCENNKLSLATIKFFVNALHYVLQEKKSWKAQSVILREYSVWFDLQRAVDTITFIHDTFLFRCNLRLCTSAISLRLKCQWNYDGMEYNEVYI